MAVVTSLRDLENKTGKSLYIRGSTSHHIESVTIRPLHDTDEIKANTLPVKPGEVLKVKVEESPT